MTPIDLSTDDEGTPVFDRLFGPNAIQSLLSDFDSIEDNFKSMLLNLATEALATNISSLILGGGGAGGGLAGLFGGGGGGGGLASLFGGFLAEGGTARSGQAHIVGENGPELFVPNTTGTVVSNADMMSSAGASINFQLEGGFDGRSEMAIRRMIRSGMLQGALNQANIENGGDRLFRNI